MLREMIIISKNTEAFLSTEGYYGYYYRDSTKRIVFEKDVEGNELTHWRNEKGWKAILLRPENLDQYPNRPCNVVWIKE